jgi:lysyl-tRNA synthetase class 1
LSSAIVTIPTVPDLTTVKAWPFEEARKVAARLAKSGKDVALFETGYGPSGLPHIGTFGEVARTSWVRHAFTLLTGLPSRLIAFSDDMDGLRKGAGQRAEQGDAGRASRPVGHRHPRPLRHA